MIYRSEGYLLKKYDLTESSYIVHFFTKEYGLTKVVAKGAKRKKSPFLGILEILNLLEIEFYKKEEVELGVLKKAEMIDSSFHLFSRYEISKYLFAISEILTRGTKEGLKEEKVFRLIYAVIEGFKNGLGPIWLFNYFLLWFLKINGLLPNVEICGKCRKSKGIIAFDVDEGGFLCERCKSKKSLIVSPKMVKTIRELLIIHPLKLKGKIDEEFPIELKTMLYLNTCNFIGSDINSFLKE